MRRLIFTVVLLFSLAAGLLFGWLALPALRPASALANLREDYRADYVLMVAEVFSADGDIQAAAERLSEVDAGSPTTAALLAAAYSRQAGYPETDQAILMDLARAMQAYQPVTLDAAP